MDKNLYCWSDSITAVCNRFGLTLPDNADTPPPSRYLGADFQLTPEMISSLKRDCHLSDATYDKIFNGFKRRYLSQKIFEHNSTDLNIFFADFLLYSRKNGYNIDDYFDFEFYRKPVSEQNLFFGHLYRNRCYFTFNDFFTIKHLNDKAVSNRTYARFIRRDWLDLARCSLEDFRDFTSKHPTFLSKVVVGDGGHGV